MRYVEYNDYELLYLINKGNEKAEELFYRKYENLISIKIRKFQVFKEMHCDFMQEGRLILLKAIVTYDEMLPSSFFSYFTCLLDRRFSNLIRTNYNYIKRIVKDYSLDFHASNDQELLEEMEVAESIYNAKSSVKTELEKQIFDEIFIGDMPISEFCLKYNVGERKVYNALYFLRRKCHKNLSDE